LPNDLHDFLQQFKKKSQSTLRNLHFAFSFLRDSNAFGPAKELCVQTELSGIELDS
jgi:hypothetical protein